MFIKTDLFDKLLCCRRKVVEEDEVEHGVEQVVLQHTNNNQTEYITSAQLVEKLKGGTTAVVALVREKRLVVAWLGDSQALLVRRRTPVRMVEPHKPELPIERERVEEMGGCVLNIQGTWRVLGQLAVSRAIGDREYKPFVSSECDIKSLEIEGDEDFLILACDGLWDTLSPEAAVNLVYAYLTRNDGDTDGVGRCLVEAARNTGSDDNITAVVVFLRPVATIMEEEAQRIAQGQVPEPVPEAVLCKDSTPSSINAIFSPPINQFDHNNTEVPTYNPFDGEIPLKMDTENAVTPASQHLQMQEEPMEGSEAPHLSARDSDSDEGIPIPGNNDQAFNPHEAPTPTAEEVDAALAELDSIPDEVCESGDVEEEDDEEEEWSYFRMDLQTQPQAEDVLVPGSASLLDSEVMDQEQKTEDRPSQDFMEESHVDNVQTDDQPSLNKSPDMFSAITEGVAGFNKESNLMETSISNVGDYLDNSEPPSSPHAPGSPRSVEGFVTSVELNTPEEISGTPHAQDVNGSGVEQSSGPFSVYVSSSPEPVSLDPHIQTSGDFVSEMTNGQVENEVEPAGDFSPVEIVHAQSTVEVLASPTPGEKREFEMPDVPASPKVPANPMADVTFIPEPAVEPTAEKPVPVFIDEGTPVSEGEPEIPSEVLTDMHSTEPATEDLLSKEQPHEPFIMEQTCTPVSPISEQHVVPVEEMHVSPDAVPSPEPVSPVLAPVSPLMEQTVCPGLESSPTPVSLEAEEPTSMEPSLLSVSPVPEPSPALASPLEELIPASTPADVLKAPMSPVQESAPAPMSPVQESAPAPMSPVQESAPAPMSPVQESAPAPMSPVQESAPAPVSPVQESAPAPVSPVQESAPAPMSPVQESVPAPMSPVQESAPAPVSPVEEPVQTPVSPVEEAAQTSVPPVAEPLLVPEHPVVQETQAPPVSEIIESAPALESKAVEHVPVSVTPEVADEVKPESKVLDTEENEILINKGTLVIPIVPEEDVKESKPQVAKSPAKTAKMPSKADTAGKSTPSRPTPGKATPSKTPSARTPVTKSPEKKPTPSARQTQKPAPTRPAAEKTAATTIKSRTTPVGSASSKQPVKSSTRPAPKTTLSKPSPTTTTTTKLAERKAPKPATPTAPRAALSKPSATANKPAQPAPTARTTTTTTTAKRPVSAPTKRVEKTDSSKVNGTATKPAPRTTTSRPASSSTVTRKPLSTTAKSVPEKETKNTTNRILSTTTKSTQRPVPGAARSITSRTTTTGQTTLTKTAAKVDGTSSTTTTASKARMTSVTKSSTTSKAAGVAAKKTLVSKTSTTKTKTAAAASSKVQKSEVIKSPVANGENKIAHEETSVEVIEKCAAEDVIQCSTTEQVISTETVEVIVNGDH